MGYSKGSPHQVPLQSTKNRNLSLNRLTKLNRKLEKRCFFLTSLGICDNIQMVEQSLA